MAHVSLTPKMLSLLQGHLQSLTADTPQLVKRSNDGTRTYDMTYADARKLITYYADIVNGKAAWANYSDNHASARAAIARLRKVCLCIA